MKDNMKISHLSILDSMTLHSYCKILYVQHFFLHLSIYLPTYLPIYLSINTELKHCFTSWLLTPVIYHSCLTISEWISLLFSSEWLCCISLYWFFIFIHFVSSVLLSPRYEDLRIYPCTHINWESVHKQNFWIKIYVHFHYSLQTVPIRTYGKFYPWDKTTIVRVAEWRQYRIVISIASSFRISMFKSHLCNSIVDWFGVRYLNSFALVSPPVK